jgi:hypothetical protein
MIRSGSEAWLIRGHKDRRLSAIGGGWALASAAAVLAVEVVSPLCGVAVVVIAAVVATIALADRPVLCLAVVVGLAPALVVPTLAALAWIVAGALVALAIAVDRPETAPRMDDLRRHISAARRRNERADVVVFALPTADLADYASLLASFRLTDSTAVTHVGRSFDVEVVLDHAGLDRDGIERRIASQLATCPLFGWATFPDDGVTLEALLATARGRRTIAVAGPNVTAHRRRGAQPTGARERPPTAAGQA